MQVCSNNIFLFWYFAIFFFTLPVIGIYLPGLFWCTMQSFIIRQDLIMITFCLVTSTSLLSMRTRLGLPSSYMKLITIKSVHYLQWLGVMISGKETLLLRVFLFVCFRQNKSFHPSVTFHLGHRGSRLSRIFHTSVCPVTLSSSSWGDPQVSQARQDILYNPSSEFCELNMPRISPIQVRSSSIILVVWQLYGWCLQSSATYTKTTHMNK